MSSPQGTHGALRRPSAQTLFTGAALDAQHPLEEGCLPQANATQRWVKTVGGATGSFFSPGTVRGQHTVSHRGGGARAMLTHLRTFGLHGHDWCSGDATWPDPTPSLLPSR